MSYWKLFLGNFLFLLVYNIHPGAAQQHPSFGLYYFNSSLYNPSYVGNSKLIEGSFRYYKQWANMEDAPSSSSFTLHYPTKTNVSLGLSIFNDKSVLLKNTSLLVTYGYRVPLGYKQHLKFGLSAGAGVHSYDLSKVNTDDPAVLMAMDSKVNFQAQFGVHYRNKNLKLGFSLPRISISETANLSSDYLIADDINNYLGVRQFSASYVQQIKNSALLFEPVALYRIIPGFKNQWEMMGILHYKDIISLGTSYQQHGGATAFAALKILEKFAFGYAYGMGPAKLPGISEGSHEVQVKIFLKKQSAKKTQPALYKGAEKSESDCQLYYTIRKATKSAY